MPEVVQPAKARRIEHELVDELLERCLERPRRHVHDPGQDIRHEAATDDRAGAGRGLRLGRQAREPDQDRVLDGVRDAGFADRGAVDARLGAERAEQLLDVERDAVGPLVHRGRDVARRRQPGTEEEGRDEGRLAGIERHDPELLGDPLGDQA